MNRIGVFFIFSLVIRYWICEATDRYATLTAACACDKNDTDTFVINVDVDRNPTFDLSHRTILRANFHFLEFSRSRREYEIYLMADPTPKIESNYPNSTNEGSAKRHHSNLNSTKSVFKMNYLSLFTGWYFFQFVPKNSNCKQCVSDRVFVNGSYEYQELTVQHTYNVSLTWQNGTGVRRRIRVTVPAAGLALNVSLYSNLLKNSSQHDYKNTSVLPIHCIISFTDPLDEKTDNKSCTGDAMVHRDKKQFQESAVSFVINSSEPRRPNYFYIVKYTWLDNAEVVAELEGWWGVRDAWQASRDDSKITVYNRPGNPSEDVSGEWTNITIAISFFGLTTVGLFGITLQCMLQKRPEEPEFEDTPITPKGRSPRPGSLDVLFLYARETPEFDMLIESVKKRLEQSPNLQIHDFQTLKGYAEISHLNLDDWIEDWFKNDTKIVWFDTPMLRSKLSNKQNFQQIDDSRDRLLRVALTWAKHYHVGPTTRHSRDFVVRITGCVDFEVRGESDADNPLSIIGQHRYYYIPDHFYELYEALSETEIVEIKDCEGSHSEHRSDISSALIYLQ